MKDSYRAIIAGGGTGGHIFPGIALAEELSRSGRFEEILFVGAEGQMEEKILPSSTFRSVFIPSRGLKGKGFWDKVRALSLIPSALRLSIRVIDDFQPDIIIGVGGYASFSIVAAGILKGKRTVILEQNSIPGLTNRLLGRFAGKVFISFPDSSRYFSKNRVIFSGNPLRRRILEGLRFSDLSEIRRRNERRLLVMGGSHGARRINYGVLSALDSMNEGMKGQLSIIHQCGFLDHEDLKRRYAESNWKVLHSFDDANGGFPSPKEVVLIPFIQEVERTLLWADLVISRAGAGAVSEIMYAGKPSILVPYPHATDNHQLYNARYLSQRKCAILLSDGDFGGDIAGKIIEETLSKTDLLKLMGSKAKALSRPDASKVICNEILSFLKRR